MAIKHGVSLYSFQENYYLGKLDLEGCIAAAKAAGCDGIEVIPEQMPIGRYPYPSEADVDRWFGWMDKYGTKPTCMDIFDDYKLFKNRFLRPAEKVAFLEDSFKRASQLGFYIVRAQNSLEIDVVEAAIPMAEHYNVIMGFENHAPLMIKSERNQALINLVEKTGTEYVKILPDFGIFEKHAPQVMLDKAVRQGLPQAIADYIMEASKGGVTQEEIAAYLKKANAPASASMLVRLGVNHYNDPNLLREIKKYLAPHFHAKFYDMTPDYVETTIDYENPIRVLKDMGWDGYISSEFEGQRSFHDIELGEYFVDEVEQVRRQTEMVRRYAGE
jgi:sugar phosphate isomerase/epimerase